MMLERLSLSLMIIGSLGLLWLGWRYYKQCLIRSIQSGQFQVDKPALLYFTADYCAACRFQQKPILEKITAKFGEAIIFKEYDVTQYPELAGQYKVLTLPTTVILDHLGQVVDINYGVTQQAQLERQLS
jgi:thioredoxin-like negative regulator of GroEL